MSGGGAAAAGIRGDGRLRRGYCWPCDQYIELVAAGLGSPSWLDDEGRSHDHCAERGDIVERT